MLKKWNELPDFMRVDEVKPYWEILNKKRGQLLIKRVFDFVVALILLIILAIPMLIIAILIKIDSKGPVLFKQKRTGKRGKLFTAYKFRTMAADNDVHDFSKSDQHTKVGKVLRATSLDEIPQLINVYG